MSEECKECGMIVGKESPYHPYAACLMFKACGSSDVVQANLDSVLSMGEAYGRDKALSQHKAITEAAKFLVKVKRHKDTGGAWYSASWPIALRKIEEAVDNLGEDDE